MRPSSTDDRPGGRRLRGYAAQHRRLAQLIGEARSFEPPLPQPHRPEPSRCASIFSAAHRRGRLAATRRRSVGPHPCPKCTRSKGGVTSGRAELGFWAKRWRREPETRHRYARAYFPCGYCISRTPGTEHGRIPPFSVAVPPAIVALLAPRGWKGRIGCFVNDLT